MKLVGIYFSIYLGMTIYINSNTGLEFLMPLSSSGHLEILRDVCPTQGLLKWGWQQKLGNPKTNCGFGGPHIVCVCVGYNPWFPVIWHHEAPSYHGMSMSFFTPAHEFVSEKQTSMFHTSHDNNSVSILYAAWAQSTITHLCSANISKIQCRNTSHLKQDFVWDQIKVSWVQLKNTVPNGLRKSVLL